MIRKRITLALLLMSFLITSVFGLSLNSQASNNSKVKKISVSNAVTGELTVVKGKKYKLVTEVYPENTKNKKLKYKSSNTKVVTVSSTGTLVAKKAGKAKITVKSKSNSKVSQTIIVKVVTNSKFKKVKKIIPNFKEKEMNVNDTTTLTLTFNPTKASNTNVTFTSSDEDVVTVSDLGVITAIGEGEAVITVKACDGSKVKTKIEIHVKGEEVEDSDSAEDDSDESSEVELSE